MSFLGGAINHFIAHWGYLSVFVMTALEGFGLFFIPGETTLMAAAIYAAETHRLSIMVVFAAAVAGAVLGDNVAYWVGREFGFRLLRRYGHYVHLHEKRVKFVQYLFLRYGRPIVFTGRFVMLLRAWEAFLAGADAMPWREFAPVNAAAIVLWACVWGFGAYEFGLTSKALMEKVGIGIFVVVCVVLIVGGIYFRRHEEALEAKADQALPGALRRHRPADLKPPASPR
ncbi:MAG: DedA family protein [Acetobacteraceae bacterium]